MAKHILAILISLSLFTGGEALHVGSAVQEQCGCLNWKDTYAAKKVVCGMSNEIFLFDKAHYRTNETIFPVIDGWFEHYQEPQRHPQVLDELCTRFFEKLDNNYCVNVNMGKDEGQWCYVDPSCTSGNPVTSAVSWKPCDPIDDKRLRDTTPEQLSVFAKQAGLDLGLLHKMSYPLRRGFEDGIWSEVSMYWGVDVDSVKHENLPAGFEGKLAPDGKTVLTLEVFKQFLKPLFGNSAAGRAGMSEQLRAEMKQIYDSGLPHSFDTTLHGHPPHVITVGPKVYTVHDELVCLNCA